MIRSYQYNNTLYVLFKNQSDNNNSSCPFKQMNTDLISLPSKGLVRVFLLWFPNINHARKQSILKVLSLLWAAQVIKWLISREETMENILSVMMLKTKLINEALNHVVPDKIRQSLNHHVVKFMKCVLCFFQTVMISVGCWTAQRSHGDLPGGASTSHLV